MYLATIRARFFLGALLATGLTSPMPANSQSTSLIPGFERPDVVPVVKRVPQKTSFAFRMSESYLAAGTAFDLSTTAMLLNHPTTVYKSDGTLLTHYYTTEDGWTGDVFGKRDLAAALLGNGIKNALLERFTYRLYERGGRWRALGYGLNFLQGSLSLGAGVHNVRFDGQIDRQVRLATGYKGLFHWGR